MIREKEYIVRVCCPVCGSRIADRLSSYSIEVQRLYEENQIKWRPDLIEKCYKCKSPIGIKICK